MMDDYYLLLGISRDSGMTQIKRAYRRLSLRFHPDVTGAEGAEQFARVKEAYDTLAHASRKADYDRRLSLADEVRTTDEAPEPLVGGVMDLFGNFATVHPGSEEILAHILNNYIDRAPKSHPARELNVEIVLTPRQAAKGGTVPMVVPVARVCGRCGGTGRTGYFFCDACDGHGTVWEKARVDVTVPANAAEGTVIETSLRHLGIRNMWLKTHVRVTLHQTA
ncbi:MAG TPA: DnaJ domain-containing protein [Tepidisphaeraceae bacterium]|jgi:molecular chaperone DnaJ